MLTDSVPRLVVLSAPSGEQLEQYVRRILAWVAEEADRQGPGGPAAGAFETLARLAYTLQVGREAMRERLALVVSSLSELREELGRFLDGTSAGNRVYRGRAPREAEADSSSAAASARDALRAALDPGDLEPLARCWVNGLHVDWSLLYPHDARPPRLSVPTVPFLKKRYWLEEPEDRSLPGHAAPAVPAVRPHPLVGVATGVAGRQSYATTLTGAEYFLRDHALGEQKVLPAVAALEMAVAGGARALGRAVTRVENVLWSRPVIVTCEPVEVRLALTDAAGGLSYEIECDTPENGVGRCGAGMLYFDVRRASEGVACVELERARADCPQTASGADVYAFFERAGVSYGPGFRSLRHVWFGPEQALARVELPDGVEIPFESFVLHPSLMDGALQAASWVGGPPEPDAPRSLPFALARLEILHPLVRAGYVRATRARTSSAAASLTKYDLDLLDDDGRVLVRITGFARRAVGALHALRPTAAVGAGRPTGVDPGVLVAQTADAYEQVWEGYGARVEAAATAPAGRLVVLSPDPDLPNALRERLGGSGSTVVWVAPGAGFAQPRPEHWHLDLDDLEGCRRLFAALGARAGGQAAPAVLLCRGLEHAVESSEPVRSTRPALRLFRLFRAWSAERSRAPLRLLIFDENAEEHDDAHPEAWSGSLVAPLAALAKTMANEDPGFLCSVVGVTSVAAREASPARLLADIVVAELQAGPEHEFHVRYQGAARQVRRWHLVAPLEAPLDGAPFREDGVYLVTGGLGALGRALVKGFGASGRGRFVLAGRGASASHERETAELRELGIRASYHGADLGRPGEAQRLIAWIRAEHGALNGILHLAGIKHDAFLSRKTDAEFEQVLAPKVMGTLELDRASLHEPLDFFVLFSSLSGAAGSPGQGDYAYANAFLDTFAAWRERQRQRGARSGKTLSILWPAWAEGGMRADEETASRAVALSGIEPLQTSVGLAALAAALRHAGDHVLVASGERTRVRAFLETTTHVRPAAAVQETPASRAAAPTDAGDQAAAGQGRGTLAEDAERYLKGVLARAFKLAPEELEADTAFEVYGIDSILIMDLTRALEQDFGPLPKTLFFEYQDIAALCAYFVDQHAARLASLLAPPEAAAAEGTAPDAALPAAPQASPSASPAASAHAPSAAEHGPLAPVARSAVDDPEPIAIIGVSARFAQADDLESFWENLKAGRDCVVEIPRTRWNWRDYDSATEVDAASRYSRWGSFLSDVDRFDALFFGIAPREAEIIDPQERLFLETAWHALEDAGYTKGELRHDRVGVYVGVMYGLYQLYESDQGRLAASSYASIANRVSYTLGFRGPSVALDTMCSSALTAIHLACQALRAGEIDVAVAGGVNLHVHPYKYRLLGQGQFTSSDGRCRSFGADGDGYVPGEGVGAILLKPVGRALRDGDHVYGRILGTALNHGGKTNGYTVPNPVAQGDVIRDALAAAGIAAESLSYVEAHGTGTALGDPVEIRGLMRAFEGAGPARRVPIGSVKSNIGHLESAAGIAALVKVLLQMKHRMLVPSIHSETLNANIDWESSPFYVQRACEAWRRPVAANGEVVPLRAGISSFGAGGANAHVLLEEHQPAAGEPRSSPAPRLAVFSAKTKERLRAHAAQFAEFLRREPDADLASVAFTLQVGREGLEERLAIVADSVDELVAGLSAFLAGGLLAGGVFQASLRDVARGAGSGAKGAAGAAVRAAMESRDLSRLGELWVQGASVEWRRLYESPTPGRVPLPGYPFEKTRCWIDAAPASGRRPRFLHPLLDGVDMARSLGGALAFRKVFRADDPIIGDHRVGGVSVLPGVALLEMALAALKAADQGTTVLKQIRWLQPLVLSEEQVTARLELRKTGQRVSFELVGESAGVRIKHAEGTAELVDHHAFADELLPVDELRARCTGRMDGADLYREYEAAGFSYGAFFRTLESVVWNDDEALGRLVLPDDSATERQDYELHPALMDGALHALAAFRGPGPRRTMLPYSLEQVVILHPLARRGYVHVRRGGADHYHLALLDDAGRVCVRLEDLALRPAPESADRLRGLLYAPQWIPIVAPAGDRPGEHDPDARAEFTAGPPDAAPPGQSVWIVRCRRGEALARALAEEYAGQPVRFVDLDELSTERAGSESLHDAPLPDVTHFLGGFRPAQERHDDLQALEASQQDGVWALLRLVKWLLARGASARALRLTVTTLDACDVAGGPVSNPFAGSLHGFTQSLAREYPRWDVGLFDAAEHDLRTDEDRREVARRMVRSAAAARGTVVALRAGALYRRRLVPLEQTAPGDGGLRSGGVYLLIGGAGGIGLEVTDWLVRRWGARVVLVGRRPLDPERQRRVQDIDPSGQHVTYHQADAGNPETLKRVVVETKTRYGALHGVFHAAIVLRDQTVERMDEATFREALDAKARVCVALLFALRDERPDFVLFFSSAVSLSGSAGQSNYAAGCALKDSYARALEEHLSVPVKVINWGYWGTVGVVAREAYRRRLAEQGIGSISPEEGLEAMDRVLRHPSRQVMVMKARPEVLAAAGVDFSARLRWQPREQASLFEELDAVNAAVADRTPVLLSDRDQARLEGIGREWLWRSFRDQGLFTAAGERWTLPALAVRLGALPKHARLLAELVRILAVAGRLGPTDDGTTQVLTSPVETPEEHPSQTLARLSGEVAALRGFEQLLRPCMDNLFRVLRGEVQATEVLFPQSSMTLVESTYRGNPLVDLYNDLTASVVSAYLRERMRSELTERPLRVLEVGAGTGATTLPVLKALAAHHPRVRYCYTDVSKAFLHHGRQQYGSAYPMLEFELLDIGQDVERQGFTPGSYDVVVASNVLHATRDVHASLGHVKALLKPNGWLVLNEVTRNVVTTTLTFGLLDGWWLHEDAQLRLPGSPLLSPEGWRRALHATGFPRFKALPEGVDVRPAQHVMVAESDGLLLLAGDATRTPAARERQQVSVSVEPARAPSSGVRPLTPVAAGDDRERLRQAIERHVKKAFERVLQIPEDRLWPDETFESYGVDSLSVPQIVDVLADGLGSLSSTLLFEYPTIRKLTEFFVESHAATLGKLLLAGSVGEFAGVQRGSAAVAPSPSVSVASARLREPDALDQPVRPRRIAIIGLAGRYPMARDLTEFWRNLQLGRDCVREVPAERWDWRACPAVDGAPVSRWGGFLDGVDQFDPLFFNMSRREAELADPQERLFLETVWQTLEDAACTRARLRASRVGVYVGVMYGHYQLIEAADNLAGGMGYASIANRVSYFFDFQGPSLAVDSMCSASLSAIHLACQALLLDEIDYAVAGGVNLAVHPRKYVQLAAGRFTSSDGRCRSFGEGGDGMVPGEGVGAILLKPLERAQQDGDRIHGVILGSALNHGGKTSGYSVPNPVAQGSVIEDALRRARIEADSLGYVEAHGTGTALGDPIEINGLMRAFRGTARPGKIPIGSLKSGIGHLESAAGIAAVTKVLLQMKHHRLAPSLHAERPNPGIDWEKAPFAVQTELAEWPSPAAFGDSVPRRAGVSAFGAGGANAHLILEAYEVDDPPTSGHPAVAPRLFVLSARNEAQLRECAAALAQFLARPGGDPAPVERTPQGAEVSAEAVATLLGELIGVPGKEIGLDEPLADMGLDDTAALRFGTRLAELYALDVPPAAIGEGLTLRAILARQRGSLSAGPRPEETAPDTAALDLDRVAYTLQVGREAMEERLALVVSSPEELCQELQRCAEGAAPPAAAGCRGNARATGALSLVMDGEDGRAYVRTLLARRDLSKLAQLWVHGVELDWSALHETGHPRPMSLPSYPFARTRCWLKAPDEPRDEATRSAKAVSRALAPAGEDGAPEGAAGEPTVVLYEPEWLLAPAAAGSDAPTRLPEPLALLAGAQGVHGLAAVLRRTNGSEPVVLEPGAAFERVGARGYRFRLTDAGDHARVLADLEQRGLSPRTVVWLPSASAAGDDSPAALDATFFTALPLIQAFLRVRPEALLDLVCVCVDSSDLGTLHRAALAGLFRSLAQEAPRIRARLVHVPASVLQDPTEELVALLAAELSSGSATGEVLLRDGARRVRAWTRSAKPARPRDAVGFKARGVYLITGGGGGLGLLFARSIAGSVDSPRLILTGRSPLDSERQASLDELRAAGAEVVYLRSDVSVEDDVRGLMGQIRSRHGCLHGVLHAAGLTRDSLLRNKTRAEANDVLAPKVAGTLHLDRFTAEEALDFFVTFSSASAVFGSVGQCDYTYANCFLDRFAAYREGLRSRGLRSGRSLSINWPLWQDGGMAPDESRRRKLAGAGLVPLEHGDGFAAFASGLALEGPQVLVLAGDPASIGALVAGRAGVARQETRESSSRETGVEPAWVGEQVLSLMSAVTGFAPEELDPDRSFEAHGLDSVGLTKLAEALNRTFQLDLAPTIFFEATTVRALTARLWERHSSVLPRDAGAEPSGDGTRQVPARAPAGRVAMNPGRARRAPDGERHDPVAVIGMAGVLPGSNDLEAFWERLQSGEPLVTEVPPDRWDWSSAYGDPHEHPDRTRVKWGGFMPRVDQFDPLFFGISPREADWMDPQQRLLLQTVWKAVEDAGLHPGALAGSDTGLFVGVGPSEYADLVRRSGMKAEVHATTGLTASMLVNRVSYQLDLRGPSEPVDTACSSSLVALHRAAEALEHGHCRVAIAGGVNVLLSPLTYSALERAGMLSADGVGRAFDRDANGYVRGEGVGVVLLKKLSLALADGDPIHALLCGTAVNHGGRSSSLTAPNPDAQAEVVVRAWEQAGLDPSTIACIESHGTGTVLGDPVELNGLKKAFAQLYRKWNKPAPAEAHCALVALKNVIGHLEPAAGIAAVLRLVLAMRHGRLTGTPNVRELNPYLELSGTPFYVAREGREWKALVAPAGVPIPRRAGVSSFGYGGVNAHAAFEEYRPERSSPVLRQGPVVFVLSARKPERLRAYVREFLRPVWVARWAADLAQSACTLQAGRATFEERLAVVVRDPDELRVALSRYLDGDTAAVHTGRAGVARGVAPPPAVEAATDLDEVARRWVQGAEVDWKRFYAELPQRRSLPTYPFAPERHWFSRGAEDEARRGDTSSQPVVPSYGDRSRSDTPAFIGDTSEALYFRTVWEPAAAPQPGAAAGPALVFATDEQLLSLARRGGDEMGLALVVVKPGRSFQQHGERVFEIDPRQPQDYTRLLIALRACGFPLTRIAHLWGLQRVQEFPGARGESLVDRFVARSAGSLFLLLKALASEQVASVRRIQVASREDDAHGGVAFAEALGAFAGSLRALAPEVGLSVLRFVGADGEPWSDRCLAELGADPVHTDAMVRYAHGTRRVQRLQPLRAEDLEPARCASTHDGGVYLITGGTGALGMLLGAHLARRHRARLALMARSPLDPGTERRLEALRALGAEAAYHPGAVEDGPRVREVVEQVKARWGRIDGVFHLAGVVGEHRLHDKDVAELREALRARIDGTLNLDEATRGEPLELFVLYSSTAAHLGDFGLLDYALGHRFLDGFAAEREARRNSGERQGRTLSINWPLWRAGGMHVSPADEERYLSRTGFAYLETPQAERALQLALGSGFTQVMVTVGDRERILALVGEARTVSVAAPIAIAAAPATASRAVPPAPPDGRNREGRLVADLKRMLSGVVGVDAADLASDVSFGDYGLDSFGLKTFSARLSEAYRIDLATTALFAANTVDDLARHLQHEFPQVLEHAGAPREEAGAASGAPSPQPPPSSSPRTQASGERAHSSPGITSDRAIAVIGMSGRFPDSPSVDVFWEHLEQGRDLISEVPPDRWDWREIAERYPGTPRWGGFLADADRFDALFFRISPLEARVMDPQHRLFLQESWKALEDAGYRADRLAGKSVSVFAGVQFNDYESLVVDAGERNAYSGSGLAKTMLANRISYLLDLRGPSEAIDTACSSSLVALHRALRSLRDGESELAIAGGVSLILSPKTVVSAHGLGVLSPQGRCKTLDRTADGYVKGEGVAVLVLKPLARAVADGDPIHAVILGSAVSHGGRAHSLTAPNPTAQADLLVAAYRDAGIAFASVSCLELHGTGTELGDPVEVDGVQQAYLRLADGGPRATVCGLGTVKSNVGHLEPAAGVAGVVKAILAMKHGKIPGSLHIRALNPLIRLEGTPFEPVLATRDWRPVDQDGRALPRRAGVSSFGFGGVNAHLVLEEYVAPEPVVPNADEARIFVLSARNEERLRHYAADVVAFLRQRDDGAGAPALLPLDMASLTHTFQVGRVPMATRLAAVVRNPTELREKLEGYLRGESGIPQLHTAGAEPGPGGGAWLEGTEGREYVDLVLERGNLDRIARLWVGGADVDWRALPAARPARRMSAPTYPFAPERCWIDAPTKPRSEPGRPSRVAGDTRLLSKVWRPEPDGRRGHGEMPSLPAGIVLVLTNSETESLGRHLFVGDPQVTPLFVSGDKAGPRDVPGQIDAVVGIVDLCDLTSADRDRSVENWGRITLYQALIRKLRGRAPFFLHFTRNLRALRIERPNLAGANFAGLVRMLSAEYRSLQAATLDLDAASVNAPGLRRIIGHEVSAAQRATEVCYRDGVRHLAAMEDVSEPVPTDAARQPWFAGLRDEVVVISGGTRGIGLAVARDLVEKGANRLALMGRQPLPPVAEWQRLLDAPDTEPAVAERLRRLVTLQRPGVQLRCYAGRLEDQEQLERWLGGVRAELGPIAGVIHCAGVSTTANPAFISKTLDEMRQVLEPKVGGLEALAAACASDSLRFFVLFSSVSAQIPVLAAGISDYALANAFMDHFAEFQAARGRSCFRSLQWPSWQSMGMAEVKSKAYRDLGLRTLATGEGLELLHRAMAVAGAPSLMPCLVDPETFAPEQLLRWPGASASPAAVAVAGEIPSVDATAATGADAIRWLTGLFAEELQMDAARLPESAGFAEFGVDSIMIAQLIRRLEAELDVKLDPTVFLESSSLVKLARRLEQDQAGALRARFAREREAAAAVTPVHAVHTSPVVDARHIAVVGLACHFPGAPSHEAFWRNLAAGRSAISDVPPARWDVTRLYSPRYEKGKSISKWGGFLPAIEEFDPDFFRIDRALAAQIDPLIRQVLEVSVECVQDAGLERAALAGRRIAVLVGGRSSNFGYYNQDELRSDSISGLAQNFIAAHVAHFMDLRGANMVVDSACSSSLVSVHLACQSLRMRECEMALAGGVEILLDEVPFVGMSEGRALSPTGKCHTFDSEADGIVLGEGAGMLLLKRLEDALRDGDRIYAVIEASAVNNDGRTMGITTPNPEAQKDVIEEALAQGGLRATDIAYVEAHGTGTMIGDPIELKALTDVFRKDTGAKGFCGVGSVKTNVGHLLSAAGIAGLIKVILAIHHRQLPPTLNCQTLNPRFKFEDSPFYPVRTLQDWPAAGGARRAGISSFGFGGTNAHVIVGEGALASVGAPRVTRPALPPVEYQRRRYWSARPARPAGNGVERVPPSNGDARGAGEHPLPPRGQLLKPFLELRFESEPNVVR